MKAKINNAVELISLDKIDTRLLSSVAFRCALGQLFYELIQSNYVLCLTI